MRLSLTSHITLTDDSHESPYCWKKILPPPPPLWNYRRPWFELRRGGEGRERGGGCRGNVSWRGEVFLLYNLSRYLQLHCEEEKVWASNTCDNVTLTPLLSWDQKESKRLNRKHQDGTVLLGNKSKYDSTIQLVHISLLLHFFNPTIFIALFFFILWGWITMIINNIRKGRGALRFCFIEIRNINIVGNLGEEVRE